MKTNEKVKAIAYLRTSSAANVSGKNGNGEKDSDKRQRAAILAYAKAAKLSVIAEYYDAAVSGADPIESRPGFVSLLKHIEGNGVRTVIVESADRFARDLMVQELGILSLKARGVRVFTSSGDELTDTSDEMRIMLRQVMGAFAQLEKARLVRKLKGARDRKKALEGKCGGRLRYDEREGWDGLRAALLALNDGRSLAAISEALAEQGFVTKKGTPYSASGVKGMLEQAGATSHSRAIKRTTRSGKRVLAA